MDRVAMIDEEMFITGGDNGSLSLWSMHKKKPVFTLQLAHGSDPAPTAEEQFANGPNPEPSVIAREQPRWITALKTIPYSDVVLSGSWDGWVRAWRVSDDKKKLEAVSVLGGEGVVVKGVVNDISMFERGERAKDGVSVVVAVGKEHRFARWKKVEGRNGIVVLEVARREKGNGAVDEDEEMADLPIREMEF